uniref:Caveolae associated protein 1a n=1 Tax=Lepisosteus oculatus TaxID=7918 RepID=W5N441_LEPOC
MEGWTDGLKNVPHAETRAAALSPLPAVCRMAPELLRLNGASVKRAQKPSVGGCAAVRAPQSPLQHTWSFCKGLCSLRGQETSRFHVVNHNKRTNRNSISASLAGQHQGEGYRITSTNRYTSRYTSDPYRLYTDEVKVPSKVSVSKSLKELERVPEEGEEAEPQAEEQGGGEGGLALSSDEEVEIEEIIEESRAERIKRSSMRRVDDFKKAFSKEKMEKTRQKTRDNLEKTRQKTKENLEKTRHNIEKKMNKLGTRIVNTERKEKMKSSREKIKKSFTPDHTVYARSKTAVYKVPPFTFHVKKIREGEAERQGTELMEVSQEEEVDGGELLSEDNPEMQTLLEAAEDTELVLVERSRIREDSD